MQLPQVVLDGFGVADLEDLQDLLACLLLSEVVYKAAEGSHAAAAAALRGLRLQFPPATVATLTAVQFCRPAAGHAYMLARSSTALYACFRGTKQPRDYGADVNAAMRQLWWEVPTGSGGAAGSGSGGSGGSSTLAAPTAAAAGPGGKQQQQQQQQPAVHRGFLGRAEGVPIEALHAHARRQGLRLVMCGHSLGGAVAQLCTLRLLRTLASAPPPPTALRCIVFGSPAIGNAALADHVRRLGWGAHFRSIVLPEDLVPRLFLQAPRQQESAPLAQPAGAAGAGAGAGAGAEPAGIGVGGLSAAGQGASGASQEDEALVVLEAADAAEAQLSSQQPQQHLQPAVDPAAAGSSPFGSAGLRAAWAARAAAALLAHRPLSAAAGAAISAARSARAGAGAGLLALPQLLPSFVHIGKQHQLLPLGQAGREAAVAAAGAEEAAAAAAGAGAASATADLQQQQQRRLVQVLGLHSMSHYRSRAAGLCWRELGQLQDGSCGPSAAPAAGADLCIELSDSLAPAVSVVRAVARLPVMPPPGAHAQQQHASQPAQQQRQQQEPWAAAPLTVAVWGSGLECCTGALLRLPGDSAGAAQAASAVTNLASQRLLLDLQAAAAGDSSGSSSAPGWLRAAVSRLLQAATHIISPDLQQQKEPQQQPQPGLLLQFAVPAAAILQLQLQQGAMPQAATLVLLSDFAKTVAPVQLQPQVVWLLAQDPSLAAAAFEQLQAGGAAPPAEQQQQQQWRHWRLPWPDKVAAPLRGLAASAGSGVAAVGGRLSGALPWPGSAASSSTAVADGTTPATTAADAPPQPPQQPQQRPPQQQSMLGRLGQLYAQPVARRLRTVHQQLAAQMYGARKQQEALPAAAALLLQGQMLLDATLATSRSNGSGSIVQHLELAAESLKWRAGQQQQLRQLRQLRQQRQRASNMAATTPAAAAAGAEEREAAPQEEEAEEAEDDDLAELGQLSLAALLLRQRRRQWGALAGLPPPDMLLLVLHQRQLQSSSFGEGLDSAVLAAVRRLAAACRTCSGGMPLLLAVASPEPLSTPYRRQLAYCTGLSDSSLDSSGGSQRGTVVPLPWQAGVGGTAASSRGEASTGQGVGMLHVGPLQAALYVYGAARWQRHQESLQQQQQRGAAPTAQQSAGWLRSKL